MRKQPDKNIAPPVVHIPQVSQAGPDEQATPSIIKQERHYRLITPLYGGGVAPSACDPLTTIRGTEIRGLLRFWWRACFAGRYDSATKLKDAEDAFWGKAYKKGDPLPSREKTIQIEVTASPRNPAKDDIPPFIAVPSKDKKNRWEIKRNLQGKPPVPEYAAFPLRPPEETRTEEKRPQVSPVYYNVAFTLTITFPQDKREEIEATLWAWETFGGIGARTRRGFGALQLSSLKEQGEDKPVDLPSVETVTQWIKERLERKDQFQRPIIANKDSEYAPSLTTSTIQIIKPQSPVQPQYYAVGQVWQDLITRLQNFRQRKSYKRSIWPESKAIKEIASNKNASKKAQNEQKLYHFPKAVFGLPIVFHARDAGSYILQGKEPGKERLASPLLLRPLACQGGQAVGLALLLEKRGLPPGGIQLMEEADKEGNLRQVSSADENIDADNKELLNFLKNERDVLRAFWNTLGGTKL